MDDKALKDYISKNILEQTKSKEKANFFEELYDCNIIDKPKLLKGAINHFYDSKYKENNCITKDSVIDTAIEFEVSKETVHNTIYKFKNIRLIFGKL